MNAVIQTLRDIALDSDHRDLKTARLRILRFSFLFFGWVCAVCCVAAALNYFLVEESRATPLQIVLYGVAAAGCFCAKPQQLIWAAFALVAPLGIGIAAALENSLIYVFVGVFISVFGVTIFFGAARGFVYLVAIYAGLLWGALDGLIPVTSAEYGRLPAYFLAMVNMVLCLGVLIRSLSTTFKDRDDKSTQIDVANQELSEALVKEQQAVAEQTAAVRELTLVKEELKASVESLRQARYDLEEKTLKQQEIFAIIGHELRAPAAGIELIANDHENYQANQPLLEQVSKQLLRVLDDMRQIVQPEIKHPVNYESVLLSDLIDSVSIQMRALLDKGNIRLSSQLGSSPIDLATTPVRVDPFRLETILTNLIRNACLHSGGTHIQIQFDVEGDQISLRVEDDGRGIPNLEDKDLFAPWVRGDSSASGTGLGLSIVKRAVDELDGTVAFSKSTLGGAAIEARLPLETQTMPLPVRASASNLSELNLVVVDDDEILGILIERRFAQLFNSVQLYDNPEEALPQLLQNPPDVLVTDNYMPQMTGATLISRLRDQGFDRPIVGATGAALFEGVHPMIEAGADELIIKPMTPENLTQALNRIFDLPSSAVVQTG